MLHKVLLGKYICTSGALSMALFCICRGARNVCALSCNFEPQISSLDIFTVLTMANVKSNAKDKNKKGEYVRPESGFRHHVTADGSSGFKAERGT